MRKFHQTYPDAEKFQFSAHICRHTFVTELYKTGLDIKSIMAIAGHSYPMVTLETYTHVSNDEAVCNYFKMAGES